MKTPAGLLFLAIVLALPAAAQYMSSSNGAHPSGGSSSRGSASGASSASMGSSGSHAAHSPYATSSSSGSATHTHSSGSGSGMQASGRFIGSGTVSRPAVPAQRGFGRAPYVGAGPARPETALVRMFGHPQTAPRGPFITSVPRPQPGQGFFFGFGRHSHRGFHNSFCGSSFGFGFGSFSNSFNCFGGSFFDPFLSPVGVPYGAGIYYGRANSGYPPTEQVVDDSSYFEPLSAPGTYVPDALTPAQPEETPAPKTITLLQMKDGTMYGMTDYWLERGLFHYLLSYGGENAVPLGRVDIAKTVELNSAKGIDFVLRSAPKAHPPLAPSLLPLHPLAYPDLMF